MDSEVEIFYEKWKDEIGRILDHLGFFYVNECFHCNLLNDKAIWEKSGLKYLFSLVLES